MGIGVVAVSIAKIRDFEARLRRMPTVVAQKVAARAADEITALGRATFAAGETAYGETWEPGRDGQHITLRKSGGIERGVRYVANGTKIRAVLGVPWARYQISKRPIFPRAGASLPIAYTRTLSRIAVEVCRSEIGGGQ